MDFIDDLEGLKDMGVEFWFVLEFCYLMYFLGMIGKLKGVIVEYWYVVSMFFVVE